MHSKTVAKVILFGLWSTTLETRLHLEFWDADQSEAFVNALKLKHTDISVLQKTRCVVLKTEHQVLTIPRKHLNALFEKNMKDFEKEW